MVKIFDRFVPKDWPSVERIGKRPLQAGLSLLGTRRVKSRVSAVLFYSSGLTSQSALLTTLPNFWQETANHFDHLQLDKRNKEARLVVWIGGGAIISEAKELYDDIWPLGNNGTEKNDKEIEAA